MYVPFEQVTVSSQSPFAARSVRTSPEIVTGRGFRSISFPAGKLVELFPADFDRAVHWG
jgi:hypothetical protein